jgi:23S rRNA (pseudouridine1915-N3)-methyltransferase
MKISIVLYLNKLAKYDEAALKEYSKRLSRYCQLKLIKVKAKQSLLDKIPANSVLIGISTLYDTIASTELATQIADLGVQGQSAITFIVTDDPIILSHCKQGLALSKLTMSDGLTLVTLLEQIYRSYRIIHNQAYHK